MDKAKLDTPANALASTLGKLVGFLRVSRVDDMSQSYATREYPKLDKSMLGYP